MAYLCLSITRDRHVDPDEKVFYRIVVGMRLRIRPRLPEEFLGNAALDGFIESTAGELLKNGLGWAALEMNKTIASWTPRRVSKFLEDWAKSPVILNFGEPTVGNTKLFTGKLTPVRCVWQLVGEGRSACGADRKTGLTGS